VKHGAGGMAMPLQAGGFSFGELLVYLGRNASELLHEVDAERRTVTKLIPVEGAVVLATLSDEAGQPVLSFPEGEPDDGAASAAAAYVAEWLDLKRDLRPFYDMADADPILGSIVPRYRGLRLIGVPDLFEALVWSIIGQQISLHVAYLLKRRFVEAYGTSVQSGGRRYWLFPEPERLAESDPDELVGLKFTRRKAEYVVGVARMIADGAVSKAGLAECCDLDEMEKRLTSIRGIGSWSANYAIMRCLRHPDAFPAADVGLHNALKRALGMERKPTVPEVLATGKAWTGWRAYATFYLWRSLLP